MASTTYLLYGNALMSTPISSDNVTNPELLASSIVGRKATLAASAYVDFRFSALSDIQAVAVAGLELRAGGTPGISFAFSNTVQGGSELGVYSYTPTLTAGYALKAWVLDAPLATAQYCRVTFANCAAVGLCWASPILNPEYGVQAGMTRRWNDLSAVTESTLTGAATAQKRPMLRNVQLRFGGIDDDAFALFDDMVMTVGQNAQVILVPGLADGRRDRDIILGRFVSLADVTHIAPDLMEYPFEIRESV